MYQTSFLSTLSEILLFRPFVYVVFFEAQRGLFIVAKTLFSKGVILTASFLNSFRKIYFDGQDLDGHFDPLTDDALSKEPGNILADFRSFTHSLFVDFSDNKADKLKVRVTEGRATLQDGSLVSFPTTGLIVADNTTTYVYVSSLGQLRAEQSPPLTGVLLAKVTASAGSISLIEDLRPRFNYAVGPISIPAVVASNPIPPGCIMPFAGVSMPVGWLPCDGSLVDKTTYAALYAAIQDIYGQGTFSSFRLPNSANRSLVGPAPNNPVGSIGGSATATLTVGNIPHHNHGIHDPGHNHTVVDNGHGHSVYDPSHGHQVLAANYGSDKYDDPLMGSSTALTGEVGGPEQYINVNGDNVAIIANSTTGVSIYGSGTGVYNQPSGTGIYTLGTGGGDPVWVQSPYLTVQHIIKF